MLLVQYGAQAWLALGESLAGIVIGLLVPGGTMIPLSDFPAIDATLNGTSVLLLRPGYFFIRRKKIQAHKVCMLSAFETSALFLGCYL
jgi:uncharacterized membrane protein YozB (DUF420 family)